MNIVSIRTLYDYHYGMYDRVWDCIMQLSDAQFVQEFDYSLRSVRNHMLHVLENDQRWVARLQGHALPDALAPIDYATRSAVRDELDKAASYVMNYVGKVDEGELARLVRFDFDLPTNKIYSSPVCEVLLHVANHGTDHRSQVLRLLHDLGAPTLEHDFLWWDSWDAGS